MDRGKDASTGKKRETKQAGSAWRLLNDRVEALHFRSGLGCCNTMHVVFVHSMMNVGDCFVGAWRAGVIGHISFL